MKFSTVLNDIFNTETRYAPQAVMSAKSETVHNIDKTRLTEELNGASIALLGENSPVRKATEHSDLYSDAEMPDNLSHLKGQDLNRSAAITTLPALVLAADTNGLGVVRSLWKKGVKSIVIVNDPNDISLKSRLPIAKHIINSNNSETDLLELLKDYSGKGHAIIPTSDSFVNFLNDHRQELVESGFKFSIASKEITRALIDKAQEAELLDPIVPLPKTCQTLPDRHSELLEQLRLPIIFKPRSFEHSQLGSKNKQVYTEESLRTFYQEHQSILGSLIAQEIIEGPDRNLWVCNCTFSNDSEFLCGFTFRRLKLAPAHYGVTSYAVSETNDEVIRLAKKIGKELSYVGPAMIEFKYDEKDNTYKYIELNPRLGLCNYFDTECGINNVYASYLVALDQPLNDIPNQQLDDVVYVDMYDDLGTRLKDSEESNWSILTHYLSDLRKQHVFASFAWHDLGPALSLLPKTIRGCFKLVARIIRAKYHSIKDSVKS